MKKLHWERFSNIDDFLLKYEFSMCVTTDILRRSQQLENCSHFFWEIFLFFVAFSEYLNFTTERSEIVGLWFGKYKWLWTVFFLRCCKRKTNLYFGTDVILVIGYQNCGGLNQITFFISAFGFIKEGNFGVKKS
mgnify:CR=1 FL=1